MAETWEYTPDESDAVKVAIITSALVAISALATVFTALYFLFKYITSNKEDNNEHIMLDEEERKKRRKKALQRLSDGNSNGASSNITCADGDGGEHHPLIPQQSRDNNTLRQRPRNTAQPQQRNIQSTSHQPDKNMINNSAKKTNQLSKNVNQSANNMLAKKIHLTANTNKPANNINQQQATTSKSNHPERAPASERQLAPKSEPVVVHGTTSTSTSLSVDTTMVDVSEELVKRRSNSEEAVPSPVFKVSTTVSKEKTTKRPTPPPAQLLCEVLSVILGTDVSVTQGKGSWGGEGWVQRKKRISPTSFSTTQSAQAKIVLPLLAHQQSSPDSEEWSQLNSALQSITSSKSIKLGFTDSYRKGNVALAASWHCKTHGSSARDNIDNVMFGVGSKNDGGTTAMNKEGLGKCLSVLGDYLASVVASWLDKDVRHVSLQLDVQEESDEEDLFTDAYDNSSIPAAKTSLAVNTALGELIDMSSNQSKATLLITKRFLSEIIKQSSDGSLLAKTMLQGALNRLPTPEDSSIIMLESVCKDLSAITHLMVNSQEVAISLTQDLRVMIERAPSSGSSFETSSMLRSLCHLGAYSLPCIGFERSHLRSSNSVPTSRFYEALTSCNAFPLGYFDYSKDVDPSISTVINETRSIMKHSRSETSRILNNCMRKKGGNGKDNVFNWLGVLVQANEMQANLLHEQLLDEREEVHKTCSTKSYLLGVALSTLELCGRDLAKAYDKKGIDSFDTRYLISPNGLRIVSIDERRLVNDISGNSSDENLPSVYSGSTELFFLTSSLLRVSIFPSLRTQDEYSQKYRSVFSALRKMASDAFDKTAPVQDLYKRCAAVLLGYETCLNDNAVMNSMVEFSILQLRFLADLSESRERSHEFALIPEALVKLPSNYIARVARSFQRRISPQQAEQAVTYATILLGSKQPLSIQVQTELMRISGAFIASNVQHEASLQRRKQRKGKSKDEDDECAIDYRELDIYSTLNNKVHGSAVFSSPVAAKQLGPNLVKTFIAMDAVEGIDVERENHMHKNQVQSEVCELILRLWLHPSGDFKQSITSMSTETLETFVRSVSASICISVDFLYQTIMDVRDILEHQVGGQQVFGQTKTRLHRMYEHLPNSLSGMRRQLLLLCYLSRDDSIAKLLGNSSVSTDLAVMVISLLDKFSSSDGVTHPFVDFNKALKNASGQNTTGSDSVKDLLDARTFAGLELGFDVSIISHLLFALASRWSIAAGKEKNAFISSLVTHHDFDLHHFFQIFQRLIVATSQCKAGDNASILKADGYVDSALWRNQYKPLTTIGLEESKRGRRHSSVQDQFTHTSIGSIATIDQIKSFVDTLYTMKQQVDETKGSIVKNETDIINLESNIMKSENTIDEEGYTSKLEAWLVSSDSFTSETSDQMDHFYSSNAKSSSNTNLGKVLLKDARRAYKDLPKPHPNASIFVCYAEERMDIVRAVCVGPQGTPYAYGMFVFDICYPQLYPNAAPMVHFMTTGGGQVRFSPNLYNDGKVCLSLLGTTESWNEAQRWNPKESSLAQVLISIQAQILDTAEPYYTEGGGHGGMEHTTAGKKGSARYNNTLRLSTLRHAIIEPLKYPPKGFEDVVRRHFAMLRKRVLTQAKIWTLESQGTELEKRFERAYSELVGLLSSDALLACQEWEVEEVGGSTFGALPPLSDDIQTLERLDQRQDSPFYLNAREGEGEDDYYEEDFDDDGDEDMLAIALELSLSES